jgi:signal transduction histidine kinase
VEYVGEGGTRLTLVDDLVDRVGAIAEGSERSRGDAGRLDDCENRARALADAGGASEETRRAAAVEFLGNAVTALALDGAWHPGEARAAIVASAAAIDMAPGAALLAVFLRAIASADAAQLPPQIAVDLFLSLLVELGPAEAASLWTTGKSGRTMCLAAAGDAPKSRRLRTAATDMLAGNLSASPQMQVVMVDRWDRPFAALAARVRPVESARLGAWMREAAAALSPVLERDTLFERNAARERELVSAGERQLVRLGYDLHDGPLQEICALADDLRLARVQVASLLDDAQVERIGGRFDDLEARLASLDSGLRALAVSVRPTTAIERPLEHALRNELEVLVNSSNIDATFGVEGDVSDLTDSQKIVLYRLVQEALANIRKHSGATHTDVRVRARTSYVEVTVSDNGRGFDVHSTVKRALRANRLGLAGVSERVRLLGGVVDIEARIGEGVLVRATLPRWRPALPSRVALYAAGV